jgi:hypothetical protein
VGRGVHRDRSHLLKMVYGLGDLRFQGGNDVVIGRGGVECNPLLCGISAIMDEGVYLEVFDCREGIFGLKGVVFGHRGRPGCGFVGRFVGMMLVLRIQFLCFLRSELVECCRFRDFVDVVQEGFLKYRVLLSLCKSRAINIEIREAIRLKCVE